MKIDRALMGDLNDVAKSIQDMEAAGYDGAMSVETSHDPFFPLLLAAQNSERIELMTSIAVAFSRTPMLLANIGHDLNSYSKGRFILGLGSQIRPHITKRFGMPWSSPAKRMREFVMAMRAIWACWHEGQTLDFRGEFYTHSLMTPMFTPLDSQYGAPRVFLAAVGPLMTEVAGEVADGIILHAFTTEKYMREVTLPALETGLARGGRKREDFEISYPAFVVSGRNEEEFKATRDAVCKQIAFYGSTPAYAPVLGVHGWGDLQPELNRLSKEGKWDEMGTLITDDILNEFAIVGEPGEAADKFEQRFGDVVDRTTALFTPSDDDHRLALKAKSKA
ncbi:MAG: LLM class F420-dependent oxidoreductase [Gammaproteobacteria bacterium]|jgi:probable F420-dependent oxidoreductase|nr:LLM class F420-dependent oxidoreductase [Gammaproteobacteria bacterium]|tara:strand:- start:605 stop:1609 length:1005 start_codon:yes stop_codon:yes gene_type:complete